MPIIVIDLETTGLDHLTARVVEVAAKDLDNVLHPVYFVPHHAGFYPDTDGKALEINRYFERGVYQGMLSNKDTMDAYRNLHKMLQGNTIAGSNPRFDANLLAQAFRNMGLDPEPWHHRLLDLSAYAAGVLGLPLTKLPGLAKVCEILHVTNDAEHSAVGDVEATIECFRKLEAMAR